MTDLIERLRQVVRAACVPYRVYDAVCAEAADALEAKDREIKRLYRDTAAAIDEVAALRASLEALGAVEVKPL